MKEDTKRLLRALKQLEQNEAWQILYKELNEEIANIRNLMAAEAVSTKPDSISLIRVFGGNLQTLVQVVTWPERVRLGLGDEKESADD